MIANSASIEPLAKLLASKGFLRRQRHSADVRATAALALAQIHGSDRSPILFNLLQQLPPKETWLWLNRVKLHRGWDF
jgi:hypothetical protein